MPLALLDELHEESSHRFLHALRLAEMTRGRPFSQLIILPARCDGVAENFANGGVTYYICEVVPNCNFITMTVTSQCRVAKHWPAQM